MPQPVPKRIQKVKPQTLCKTFNTLLIDGSNILELSSLADTKVSSSGKNIGGITQFLLQIKLLLQKGNFRYVYVFWDFNRSGQKRYDILPTYKANRNKEFDDENISDYMKAVNAKVEQMKNHFLKSKDPVKLAEQKKQKEIFFWQRDVIMECLEELCIRQCGCDEVEADDFIGYYVTHKKPNEKIVIVSNDRDLTQLISDQVIVYVQSMKDFINTKNHTQVMGYNYQNVVLKKMLCGDASDNIKGIKGLGEKTLFTNFSDFKTRKVTLEEVIVKAKKINEERVNEKKKPLKWAENIVNKVTDGVQGEKIYEINKAVIDLSDPNCPMMTDEAKDLIASMMYAPMDTEGRSIENLYQIILKNDIDDLKDPTKFANFFTEFKYIIDKEHKNSAF
jgi:5'-3' exonuclease